MNPNCAEFYQPPKQGFFFGFVFQFCDVVEVVIIHKMIYPGLTKLDMVVEKTQNPSIGQNPLNRSKSYFSPQNLANFTKKETLHLRCLLSYWMNHNCSELYGSVTGVNISNRAALKVRVPGLCWPPHSYNRTLLGSLLALHVEHCQIFCSVFWDYVVKQNVTAVHFEMIWRAFHFSKMHCHLFLIKKI